MLRMLSFPFNGDIHCFVFITNRTRCPVLAYKLFSLKRPENIKKKTDSPFYIQATTFQDDNMKSKTF
jgi:hypothetical protein